MSQVQGNLRRAKTRAAQVWELLLLESLSKASDGILYEPKEGGSPDFLLMRHQKEAVWIEATWIYPSDENLHNRVNTVVHWLRKEAKRRGIDPVKLVPDVLRDERWQPRDIDRLPMEHQPRDFANNSRLITFFEEIKRDPSIASSVEIPEYSLKVDYKPELCGPFAFGIGLSDKPISDLQDHPLYKKIIEKGKQHSPAGRYVVWVGGQDLSCLGMGHFGDENRLAQQAISAAMASCHGISAVVVTRIQNKMNSLSTTDRIAKSNFYLNKQARFPLDESDIATIERVDLNRWKFGFALAQNEDERDHLRMLGGATIRYFEGDIELEIGGDMLARLLARLLAGHADIVSLVGDQLGRKICSNIENGYFISNCTRVDADYEASKPERFRVRISPPRNDVFWPKLKRDGD